tara:strand:- start:22 stop:657 length:636 start_codon:yes stop_codon:yes gene_type:complete
MSNLDLFSLLSRKIFHDLINPASAALNGMELLKYNLANTDAQVLEDETFQLLDMSIKKITAQITFYRFCYSDPISAKNENVSINFINNIINDYISFTRLKIKYINDLEQLNKKHAILLANTIMVLQSLFPQGADINYELIDTNTFTIRVSNPTGKINAEILGDLQIRGSDKIKNIQVRYLNELTGIYGIKYEVMSGEDNETSIKFLQCKLG